MDRRHKVVEEKSGFIHPSIHNYTMTDHQFILMNVHFNHVDLQGQKPLGFCSHLCMQTCTACTVSELNTVFRELYFK